MLRDQELHLQYWLGQMHFNHVHFKPTKLYLAKVIKLLVSGKKEFVFCQTNHISWWCGPIKCPANALLVPVLVPVLSEIQKFEEAQRSFMIKDCSFTQLFFGQEMPLSMGNSMERSFTLKLKRVI